MIKTKLAVLEGQLFSYQAELFENFFDCSGWLNESRRSKKTTLF